MQTLLTERLRLRPYAETDFDAFAKMHGDPVLKANTHAKAMSRLQARELFDGYRAAFATSGFGMMNVRHRDTDTDIGECGLWYLLMLMASTLSAPLPCTTISVRCACWSVRGSGKSAILSAA